MRLSIAALTIQGLLLAACSGPTPQDAARARGGAQDRAEAQPDTVPDLIQPRVPSAVAGDSGWAYSRKVSVDLDNDGSDESVVLIADVDVDASGTPLWQSGGGHRWQVYVREPAPDTVVTRVYARYVPSGKVIAELSVPDAGPPVIVLLEQSAERIGIYEVRYRGPNRIEVHKRFERALDPARSLSGSPRP